MSKALNAVLGIATAIIVFITLIAFINVLFEEPQYEDHCEERPIIDPWFANCTDNITVGECREQTNEKNTYDHECHNEFSQAQEDYQLKYFIAAAILGMLTVLASLLTLKKIHVTTGLILAGVILIFWSFIIGWSVTNELTRFILALANAAIIIYLAFRLSNTPKRKKK